MCFAPEAADLVRAAAGLGCVGVREVCSPLHSSSVLTLIVCVWRFRIGASKVHARAMFSGTVDGGDCAALILGPKIWYFPWDTRCTRSCRILSMNQYETAMPYSKPPT